MSDGVGCGQSALQISRPSSQLKAVVLFLAFFSKLPMMGNQDGVVGSSMGGTSGRVGTGKVGRGMLNAPCDTPNALSTNYPVVQNQGETSLLNYSVAETGSADCKVFFL